MCSLTNEFTIDNKSENNLRYSKVFLHHYYLLWIFFFLLCCISANYISSKTNAHCCMYKSIQKHRNDTNDKIILTDKYACISIISFLFHSFFFNFQIHSTTGKNYLQQNSISTSTQWSCKHDHYLFSLVIAQKIEHTYKIAPN